MLLCLAKREVLKADLLKNGRGVVADDDRLITSKLAIQAGFKFQAVPKVLFTPGCIFLDDDIGMRKHGNRLTFE